MITNTCGFILKCDNIQSCFNYAIQCSGVIFSISLNGSRGSAVKQHCCQGERLNSRGRRLARNCKQQAASSERGWKKWSMLNHFYIRQLWDQRRCSWKYPLCTAKCLNVYVRYKLIVHIECVQSPSAGTYRTTFMHVSVTHAWHRNWFKTLKHYNTYNNTLFIYLFFLKRKKKASYWKKKKWYSMSVNEDDVMVNDSPDDDMSYYIWPFTVTQPKYPLLAFDTRLYVRWLLKIQPHWREQELASLDAGRYNIYMWSMQQKTMWLIPWNRSFHVKTN